MCLQRVEPVAGNERAHRVDNVRIRAVRTGVAHRAVEGVGEDLRKW